MKNATVFLAIIFFCICSNIPANLYGQASDFARSTNSVFTPLTDTSPKTPETRLINLPTLPGKHVIWGSLGRDDRGHIWLGTSGGDATPSGHLIEYDPVADTTYHRGDVISALKAAGKYRPGEAQEKIHSRIMQASDGYLYFTSMDEAGEDWTTGTNPAWGSHLWRIKPGSNSWEHLLAAPEGLIALSVGGQYVYALGYYGHKLYQFNTATKAVRSVLVGSLEGHVSRNILSDPRGHVYVPRLTMDTVENEPLSHLVEFDAGLNELAATPLEDYFEDSPTESHGIISFTYLADRSMVFATGRGFLYRIIPGFESAATVIPVGKFHRGRKAYTPGMFTIAGDKYLLGIAKKRPSYQWVVYDLYSDSVTVHPFPLPEGVQKISLYGSVARDNNGSFYLVGSYQNPANYSISDDNLALMAEDGLPEKLLAQVSTLKGQIFPNKKKFSRRLNKTISYKYVKKYKSRIVKRARDNQRYPLLLQVSVAASSE